MGDIQFRLSGKSNPEPYLRAAGSCSPHLFSFVPKNHDNGLTVVDLKPHFHLHLSLCHLHSL